MAIIGLGCIGGSLARALGGRGSEVRGWTIAPGDRAAAVTAGLTVSPEPDLAAAIRGAATVVLCTPLPAVAESARTAMRALDDDALILHTCGLQGAAALGIDAPSAGRVLGTHPLAGSAESGFSASRGDLFSGCTVCVEERATEEQRAAVEELWRRAGATRFAYRDAASHDHLMAWVSHLPQLTSTALAAALAESGIHLEDGGPGLGDVTRLAASDVEQWLPLLSRNGREVEAALGRLERELAQLRDALARSDTTAIRNTWRSARGWRREGDGKGEARR
ncbi:MAG TPA: prephenate dehydrogenase/arogenate dehydrogenase family protein [Gemmatimonadaceae bacterium]|nr:prephenate dehydrogenase/arogenate dehydrogenase family protein [Gemmatimonadaceae bacterium]